MADKTPDEIFKLVIKGLELTYERLVKFKKEKNSPFIICRDGKIVEVPADEMPPTIKYDWPEPEIVINRSENNSDKT